MVDDPLDAFERIAQSSQALVAEHLDVIEVRVGCDAADVLNAAGARSVANAGGQ